jgi:FkbH-like protein
VVSSTLASEATAGTPVAAGAPPAAEATGLAALRALHAHKQLVTRYGEVPALLAQIADVGSDIRRAGALLRKYPAQELADVTPGVEVVRVRVAGYSTVEPLRDPLVAHLARFGLAGEITLGDFDGYLRELGDPASALYAADPDVVACVLDAQVVFDQFDGPWTVADIRRAAMAQVAVIGKLADTYEANATGSLVLTTWPLLPTHLGRLVDRESRTELSMLWREVNIELLRIGRDHGRVYVLDLDPLVHLAGRVNDPRLASYAKAYLGSELLAEFARELTHLIRALRGRTRKMLVLDADNTLWDGILGDDGPDGITAATTFRGEAFGEFQACARQLASQGVLLSVCSKNDDDLMHAVLSTNPDMKLREADFVAVVANWAPKDANIRSIADRLNLNVDSFVFADDSAFERGLVANSLPQVGIVALDDEPALHVSALLRDGWFDTLALTEEDRARSELYRADGARAELAESTATPQEYLDQLGVSVQLAPPEPHEVGRLAQLTMRTNQFNLTTQRMQQAQVQDLIDGADTLALAISSGDRFGTNGVIGGVFAHLEDDELHIDNFVMSCRVFARGIEQTALRAVLHHAQALGLRAVTAAFRPTAKNAKASDLLPGEGFTVTPSPEGDDATHYRHDLLDVTAQPAHVQLHTTLRPA